VRLRCGAAWRSSMPPALTAHPPPVPPAPRRPDRGQPDQKPQ
jgi:hypothetical protein